MFARIYSTAFFGIEAYPVEVEIDISSGKNEIIIVGLPDASVKESCERVLSAITNSNYSPPRARVVVNLAPADTRKEGPLFDLAIAIGILSATGQARNVDEGMYFLGELSLDGGVRPVRGAIAAALAIKKEGGKRLFVPTANAQEAAVVEGLDIVAVESLAHCVRLIAKPNEIKPVTVNVAEIMAAAKHSVDFADVRGQSGAKRALTIAAAGGHNVLLIGPPGSGKTMLARRLPTILPKMTFEEAIEATSIHSLSGTLRPGAALLTERPYRHPHHTISASALIGGGQVPAPGEVSLAHNGVLFLDELAEFPRPAMESLRQPLEDGFITISRVGGKVTLPTQVVLIAAANPCPCGHLGDFRKSCKCSANSIARYRAKFSGPLLDRIDMHVGVSAVKVNEMGLSQEGTSSEDIRKVVEAARDIQTERFKGTKITCNARMENAHLRKFCELDAVSQDLLRKSMDLLGLSARAYSRIVKVARTIADLEGAQSITSNHIAEAVQYRDLDRVLA